MLHYQKIDVSERIDVNKTSASKERDLCHYWFFKDIGFKFEERICNGCHDLLTMAYTLYWVQKELLLDAYWWMGISKNKALKKLNNSVIYDICKYEF